MTPKNGIDGRLPNSSPDTVVFTVKNIGTASDTYTLTCSATGGVSCISVNPTTKSLNPNVSASVTVVFSIGASNGQVHLTATGQAEDEGWYNVTLAGKPGVAFRNRNGDNQDRALCLTSGAGEAAAWECGDLVVTHGLPGYATLGHERALMLLYNSAQAVPRPTVAVAVNEGNDAAPTTVFVRLSLNGVARDSASYTGWGATAPVRQIVLAHVGTTDSSGIYPFTLLVRNQYAGATYDSTLSDTLILVNRTASFTNYGAGWSLVGVEELRLSQPGNKILWLGGDGSATVYRNVATNTWVAAAGGFRDTLKLDTGTSTYTRTDRHRVQVTFDASGRHIKTTNQVGQVSTFYWNTSLNRLDSIAVPPAISPAKVYKLAYDGNGKLDKITDPAGRVLDATVTSGQLTRLVDPDTSLYHTDFTYDASGRMTGRSNRRGFTNSYIYAKGLRVDTVKVRLDTATTTYAVSNFQPWDEQGFASGYSSQTAVDTGLAYTKIDGPRTDVADTAEFWIDRWGAPTQTRNPLGYVTKLTRGDAANPALVTRVQDAAGGVALATYNSRGNLATQTDSMHQGSGTTTPAVTSYSYADTNDVDAPSQISTPVDTMRITYDPAVHLEAQVTAQGGHVTIFSYTMSGTLKGALNSVTEDSVKVVDTTWTITHPSLATTFAYDALGNDTAVTAPSGARTRYIRDSYTRVASVYDPMTHRVDRIYNALNWATQVKVYETTPSATLVTQYNYNPNGSLLSFVDPRNVTRSWRYDAAERPLQMTDDVGNVETRYFNPGGLLDSVRNRNGRVLKNTYDAAGRNTRFAFPADTSVYTSARFNGFQWVIDTTYGIVPGDTIARTYDAANRLLTAHDTAGTVTYTYNLEGTLKSDSQYVAGAVGATMRYWYDGGNRRTKLFNGNDSVFYSYGGDAQLAKLKVQWGTPGSLAADSFNFKWDGLGRRDSLVYTNGTVVRYGYDKDGHFRYLCASHSGGGGNLDFLNQQVHYTSEDADGMVLNMTRTQGPASCNQNGYNIVLSILSASYDARHQLLHSTGTPTDQTMSYDGGGNLTFKQIGAGGEQDSFTFVANSNRVWTQIANGATADTFAYDANGNRKQDKPNCLPCWGLKIYYYNAINQMVGDSELVLNGQGSLSWIGQLGNCKYDAAGRRVASCGAINAPWQGYDGQNTAIVQSSNGSTYKWRFVHGPRLDDPLVAAYTLSGTTVKRYYLTDGQSGQLAFTDVNGYDYSTSANCGCYDYTQNGGNQAGGIERVQRFDNSRTESDQAPGLSFYRNRYYDQATGRWLTEDPAGIAGGLNLYAYAGNNPAIYQDPFGLCPYNLAQEPCTPGSVIYHNSGRYETGVASNARLNDFLNAAAKDLGVAAVVKSADRNANPGGSSDKSEHRTDLGGGGALDVHLYNSDGSQVSDRTAARWLAGEAGEYNAGVAVLLHKPGTCTTGPHVHLDTRTDLGNREESHCQYTPSQFLDTLRIIVENLREIVRDFGPID